MQYTWAQDGGVCGLDVAVTSGAFDSPPSMVQCSLPGVGFPTCNQESTTTGEPILIGVGKRDGAPAYLIRTKNDRGEWVTVAFTAQGGPWTTTTPAFSKIEDPDVSINQLLALATDPALALP